MIQSSGSQLRWVPLPLETGGMAMRPVGLDYCAVLARAGAMGADLEFIASVLPDVENELISGLRGDAAQEYAAGD